MSEASGKKGQQSTTGHRGQMEPGGERVHQAWDLAAMLAWVCDGPASPNRPETEKQPCKSQGGVDSLNAGIWHFPRAIQRVYCIWDPT